MKIALIDDKDYWLDQIKNSIPKETDFKLYYFSTYKDAVNSFFDIIFLDYYLDKDWLTGKDIIHLLDANIIIWFSSVPDCNNELTRIWADFGITKLKSQTNTDLNQLMKKICRD